MEDVADRTETEVPGTIFPCLATDHQLFLAAALISVFKLQLLTTPQPALDLLRRRSRSARDLQRVHKRKPRHEKLTEKEREETSWKFTPVALIALLVVN